MKTYKVTVESTVKRGVIVQGIGGIDFDDWPRFCDAYFSEAIYEDTREPLSERELEELTANYSTELNVAAQEIYLER